MMESVNSEEHYLHYFLQMIDYEEQIKDKTQNFKNFVISSLTEGIEKEERTDSIIGKKNKDRPNVQSKRLLKTYVSDNRRNWSVSKMSL